MTSVASPSGRSPTRCRRRNCATSASPRCPKGHSAMSCGRSSSFGPRTRSSRSTATAAFCRAPRTLPTERIAAVDAGEVGAASGLRGGSLGFVETIGQSIANIAPALTPALNITVVAGIAGTGSWLAYLIASIGMMFVAGNIGVLARRHPMAGAYFIYIGRTLGSLAGLLAGWSMIAAYAGCMLACVFAAHVFVADLLKGMGFAALMPPGWLFDLAFVGLVWLFAHRDIRLSSRVSLVLEMLSLVIIGVITAMIVAHRGYIVDRVQLDLPQIGFAGVTSALAFAVFSF